MFDLRILHWTKACLLYWTGRFCIFFAWKIIEYILGRKFMHIFSHILRIQTCYCMKRIYGLWPWFYTENCHKECCHTQRNCKKCKYVSYCHVCTSFFDETFYIACKMSLWTSYFLNTHFYYRCLNQHCVYTIKDFRKYLEI